ncbi:MAG TPA: cytochrome c oxidase subunit 3 [Polyangiaceae bacterium]|nr:cytochrome c oxidase subunit 3 [Polyangiaceae bacterium]
MSTYRPSEHPRREPSWPGTSTAQLGMYVGLASLSVLFIASLVGYIVTRYQNDGWRTAHLPALPVGLWVATACLIGQSLALRAGERRLAKNDLPGLARWLHVALAAIVGFLALQLLNWRSVASTTLPSSAATLYAFSFYMLTVLHALHVVGGLVPLLVVTKRAPTYSSSRCESVRLVRQYWDFLLIVWLVLLGTLWGTT